MMTTPVDFREGKLLRIFVRARGAAGIDAPIPELRARIGEGLLGVETVLYLHLSREESP